MDEPTRILLRIASYNIRKCVGLDRRRDPARIVRVINSLHADIVVLQEADRRLGRRLAALSREVIEEQSVFEPIPLQADSPSLGWHGNAVLVRRDMVVGSVVLLELPALEPRGAAIVDVANRGHFIRVVATHLGLTRKFRHRQLTAISERLSELDPMPTVIIGDFNVWSPAKRLEALGPNFEVHSPGRTYHSARPVAALDKLATCSAINVEDCGVLRAREARLASDHLPIWADLSFCKR